MEALFLPVFVVAVIVIGYFLHQKEKERRNALAYLAAEHGLAFHPDNDRSHHRRYAHSVFGKGRKRVASNTMSGALDLAGHHSFVRMGDYRYTVGSGKNARTFRLSYMILRVPWIGTPDLLIRSEHIGDKLGSTLGFDDIDFESEEFSRKFWVKSRDKKFAYDVVHPGMMEFLMRGPTPHVEIVDDACLVLDGTRRWDPDGFRAWMRWADRFFDLWPDHLTTRYEARGDMRGVL